MFVEQDVGQEETMNFVKRLRWNRNLSWRNECRISVENV